MYLPLRACGISACDGSVYVIKQINCVDVSGEGVGGYWWYKLGAPFCDQRSLHKPVSLRYVNNSSSHVILLKVEENKGIPLVFYTTLSC